MKENDVVDLLKSIEEINVPTWIGGGWGVDALVGFQSRPHNDIDIYIDDAGAGAFIKMLKQKDYVETKTEFTNDVHSVWRNPEGLTVDVHLLDFVENDTGTFYFDKEPYPSYVLDGKGKISGIPVNCFTAEAQLLFHQGYEFGENDIHDVLLLCKTFKLELPEDYTDTSIDNSDGKSDYQ